MEKRNKGVNAVGVAYLSLMGSLHFILECLLDYGKDNLIILVIRYFFSLSRTNSPLLRIYVFKTYQIWKLGDPWINIFFVLSTRNFPYVVG